MGRRPADTAYPVFPTAPPNSSNCSASVNLSAANGETHTYRATYNPANGQLSVWRDGVFALTWTDSTPLTSGNHIAFRTQNSSVRFDNIRATTTTSSLYYFFTDHLGSTSVLSDSSGNEVAGSRTRHLPFGGWRGTAPTQTVTDRAFTGQKENMEVGLLYFNARYYLPNTNRMISPDTIVPDPTNPQSFNRYSYTHNNPINFTDPSGHREEDCDLGLCDDTSDSPTPLQTPSPCAEAWDEGCGPGPVRSPIALQDWEIRLLILIVYWETGDQNTRQIEAVTWTILNSQAERNGTIEGLLRSGKYHSNARLEAAAGGFDPYDIEGTVPRSTLQGEAFSNAAWNALYKTTMTSIVVNSVIESYNGGDADPTHGSKYFIHRPREEANWYMDGIRAIAVDQGVDDHLYLGRINGPTMVLIFNNLISPPYEEQIWNLEVNNSQ